ncbi:MAG: methyltransferase domain-containing protein [Chitinophagaceae bacterium]
MPNSIYNDGQYLDYNPSWHIEDSPWKAGQIRKMIERNKLQFSSVAEIGCGAGEILRQLQLSYPQSTYHGYEISEQAYQLCLQRQQEGLTYYLKDMLTVGTTYDLALAIDVVEHIPDCFGFVSQFKKKAKYKIFHFPLDVSVMTTLMPRYLTERRKKYGHIHFFTKESALDLLRDTGYTIIDSFYTPASIARGKTIEAKLARYPQKLLYAINKNFCVRLIGGFSFMILAE